MTKPWLGLLRSSDIGVRDAAGAALADIVRKHPAAAIDVVRHMAAEENGVISNEHERRLVSLAKVSPATVSAVINIIKEKNFNYRVRNFCVKVLSQVGPAAATPEFVEALSENYCPVPGAYLRVLRAMGKDSAPCPGSGVSASERSDAPTRHRLPSHDRSERADDSETFDRPASRRRSSLETA